MLTKPGAFALMYQGHRVSGPKVRGSGWPSPGEISGTFGNRIATLAIAISSLPACTGQDNGPETEFLAAGASRWSPARAELESALRGL